MQSTLFIGVLATLCLSADDESNSPWQRLFDSISQDYQLERVVSDEESTPLKLAPGPVYNWGRPQQQGSTYGTLYIWTHQGNAEAIGHIWRYVNPAGQRSIVHELHSLSPEQIHSKGEFDTWQTQAGVSRKAVPAFDDQAAPTPAASPAARLQQMRSIGRNFSLHSISGAGDRTELRLLPQPFHRTESTDPTILDGALFAFVCTVGTDPEAFLQLTAVQTTAGPQWQWSLARFSHHNLYASYGKQDVWSSERTPLNPISHSMDHTYWMFHQTFTPSLLEDGDEDEGDSVPVDR